MVLIGAGQDIQFMGNEVANRDRDERPSKLDSK